MTNKVFLPVKAFDPDLKLLEFTLIFHKKEIHLTSTVQAVFPGPLHFRHLQNEKNRALEHSQAYDSTTPLSPQAQEELVWWRDNLEAWNGKALVSGSPDLVIETDASRQGWGGCIL